MSKKTECWPMEEEKRLLFRLSSGWSCLCQKQLHFTSPQSKAEWEHSDTGSTHSRVRAITHKREQPCDKSLQREFLPVWKGSPASVSLLSMSSCHWELAELSCEGLRSCEKTTTRTMRSRACAAAAACATHTRSVDSEGEEWMKTQQRDSHATAPHTNYTDFVKALS